MKPIVYLLLGAVAGAAIALLFAPESGAELRSTIQSTAGKDVSKVQAGWQAAVAKANEQLGKKQADPQPAPEQAPDDDGGAA